MERKEEMKRDERKNNELGKGGGDTPHSYKIIIFSFQLFTSLFSFFSIHYMPPPLENGE